MTLYQKHELDHDFKAPVTELPVGKVPYQKPEHYRDRANTESLYQKPELPQAPNTRGNLQGPVTEGPRNLPKQSPLEKKMPMEEDDLMKKERTRRRGMGSGMGSRQMTNPNIPQPLQMK